MEIFEDARMVSRTDLAAWLRQLATQLESGGQIFYGAAGTVTVADQVHCEFEIEREDDSEISVEIEFTWTSPEATRSPAMPEDTDDADNTDESNEPDGKSEAAEGGEREDDAGDDEAEQAVKASPSSGDSESTSEEADPSGKVAV